MKLKSLLFGSAAILAAGTGAQAADLPTAEPVEYVRICDAFGTGFYYIPGTETCLRVGGRIRVESAYVDDSELDGAAESDFNNYSSRARGQVFLDARTQTDMGLIRAFVRLQSTVGFSDYAVDYDGSVTDLDQAFVQIATDWGTLTFGHVDSFFDAPFSSNTFGSRVGIDDPTTSQTLFAYTFARGPFSATLSVEDPASSGRRDNAGDDYEGQEMPDLVGNIRYSAGWGDVLLSGVVGQIHDVNGDGVGWAVNGGFNFSIPNTIFGAGLTAGYADGRIHYITNDRGGAGDFGSDPTGPVTTDGSDTSTAWAIRGGVSAKFTPTLGAYVDGSWTSVDANEAGSDYDEWDVAADLQWTPVSGLTIGPEVAYRSLDSDSDDADQERWSVMWRIQRDF